MERFGWSLQAIDETDIESMILFVYRLAETNTGQPTAVGGRKAATAYIDQVPGW